MGAVYSGAGNVRREVKQVKAGVNGVVRNVTEIYAGVNGVRRLVWQNGNLGALTMYYLDDGVLPYGSSVVWLVNANADYSDGEYYLTWQDIYAGTIDENVSEWFLIDDIIGHVEGWNSTTEVVYIGIYMEC